MRTWPHPEGPPKEDYVGQSECWKVEPMERHLSLGVCRVERRSRPSQRPNESALKSVGPPLKRKPSLGELGKGQRPVPEAAKHTSVRVSPGLAEAGDRGGPWAPSLEQTDQVPDGDSRKHQGRAAGSSEEALPGGQDSWRLLLAEMGRMYRPIQ